MMGYGRMFTHRADCRRMRRRAVLMVYNPTPKIIFMLLSTAALLAAPILTSFTG